MKTPEHRYLPGNRGGTKIEGMLIHDGGMHVGEIKGNMAMTSFAPLKFGVFLAPHHRYRGDPAMQLRKDVKLIAEVEDLGFDEVWVGEHYSGGHETIAAPDQFLATVAEHTKTITLATGVASMSYHHPLVMANRMTQLDNITRGRVVFGTGPGKLPSDAHMMGIDPLVQRRRQKEAVEACVRLFNGEEVNMETDWFTLRDANIHLLPFHGPGQLEMAAASIASPSGPMLCGTYGLSLLSLAASTPTGFDYLPQGWETYVETARSHGHEARRDRWRIAEPAFLGRSRADVDRAVERYLPDHIRYTLSHQAAHKGQDSDEFAWARSPKAALDHWRENGWPGYGRGIFGPPEEAIARIEALQEQTGGFGTFLIMAHDIADFQDTYRSLEMFAEEVIPHFRPYRNQKRIESLEWTERENESIFAPLSVDLEAARREAATARAARPQSG